MQTQYLDNYFLDSSSNISCFFEEGAFDENKTLVQPKAQSINKIGHGEKRKWLYVETQDALIQNRQVLCKLLLQPADSSAYTSHDRLRPAGEKNAAVS